MEVNNNTNILQTSGLVTIAGKPSDDLATGTLNSIYKQAGLKK
ncbi:MAG: type II toxin-antitoxin system HicA family toxin [Desulfobacterales bacterium]|nr:type II toxin-antitoxin system HicA family toxin [Desulfobacterales bacterium]